MTPAIRIARIQEPMENGALESYLGLEVPIQRLSKGQEKPLVFMGKVGVGIEKEHLMQGKLDCYDFCVSGFRSGRRVLQDRGRSAGNAMRLPPLPGKPQGSSQGLQASSGGNQPAGLLVNGGPERLSWRMRMITEDTGKFVTEIRIPVKKQ